MVNVLTEIRNSIKDALTDEGINAVEYVKENIVPPVCVVVPANPFILTNEGAPFSERYSVGMHVLVIAAKGTNRSAAIALDERLIEVIVALENKDYDISEVTGPQDMSLKGIPYTGAVVTLELNTNIEKEVI